MRHVALIIDLSTCCAKAAAERRADCTMRAQPRRCCIALERVYANAGWLTQRLPARRRGAILVLLVPELADSFCWSFRITESQSQSLAEVPILQGTSLSNAAH